MCPPVRIVSATGRHAGRPLQRNPKLKTKITAPKWGFLNWNLFRISRFGFRILQRRRVGRKNKKAKRRKTIRIRRTRKRNRFGPACRRRNERNSLVKNLCGSNGYLGNRQRLRFNSLNLFAAGGDAMARGLFFGMAGSRFLCSRRLNCRP